jgi:hypothetical protein
MNCNIIVDFSKVWHEECVNTLTPIKNVRVQLQPRVFAVEYYLSASGAFKPCSQVSSLERLDASSLSAILSATSRKDGFDPIVIALMHEIVRLGGFACAVNGIAEPDLIRLKLLSRCTYRQRSDIHTFGQTRNRNDWSI